MAEALSSTQKPHNKSGRKHRLNIDMTPMVDLGFLLITFFIFSAMLIKPTAMKLFMPAEKGNSTPAPAGKTITLLLSADDKLLCYEGFAKDNNDFEVIDLNTDAKQLRARIIAKIAVIKNRGGTGASLTVIIKPSVETNYKTLVAVLDEMTINEVKKYAVANIDNDDRELMAFAHLR